MNGSRHKQGPGGRILTALALLCLGSVPVALADHQREASARPLGPRFAARRVPQERPAAPRLEQRQEQKNARMGGFAAQNQAQQPRNNRPLGPGQQHLPEWFERHQTQTPQQQEQALRGEPGFARLPPQQQQNLVNRLHSLDNAPPAQRARILARNENFEHLPPERRQEIRGASQALSQMSPDRQHMVRRAFQDLRNLPPEQRQNALNSARFQAEYSPQERTVLGNLLTIEPYQP